jgi:hypothetical protein
VAVNIYRRAGGSVVHIKKKKSRSTPRKTCATRKRLDLRDKFNSTVAPCIGSERTRDFAFESRDTRDALLRACYAQFAGIRGEDMIFSLSLGTTAGRPSRDHLSARSFVCCLFRLLGRSLNPFRVGWMYGNILL